MARCASRSSTLERGTSLCDSHDDVLLYDVTNRYGISPMPFFLYYLSSIKLTTLQSLS